MRIYSSFVSPNHDYLQPRYSSPTAKDKAKINSGNSKVSIEHSSAQAKDNRESFHAGNSATNHVTGEGTLQSRESINLTSLTSAERQLIIELRKQDKDSARTKASNPNALKTYIETSKTMLLGRPDNTGANEVHENIFVENESLSTSHDLVISETEESSLYQEAETISYNSNQDKVRFAQEIEDMKTSDRLVREGSYINLFV